MFLYQAGVKRWRRVFTWVHGPFSIHSACPSKLPSWGEMRKNHVWDGLFYVISSSADSHHRKMRMFLCQPWSWVEKKNISVSGKRHAPFYLLTLLAIIAIDDVPLPSSGLFSSFLGLFASPTKATTSLILFFFCFFSAVFAMLRVVPTTLAMVVKETACIFGGGIARLLRRLVRSPLSPVHGNKVD